MKIIVAGPRDFKDYDSLKEAIEESGFEITEVVSGCATGVDTLGEEWADANDIPVKKFPALWDAIKGRPEKEIKTNKWGKRYWVRAGFDRNQQMADYADGLLVVRDGPSSGTDDMIKRAKEKGIPVYIHEATVPLAHDEVVF